ncbi:hypothetical protein IWX90DRAFT_246525 [Phyllosticta citrichinensis]|uniref:Uncharacterized protein n=1 Tax=Phyllosticta citrichinensis TaxID=1130410 RepID=A0ABR1XQM5_9PEZI
MFAASQPENSAPLTRARFPLARPVLLSSPSLLSTSPRRADEWSPTAVTGADVATGLVRRSNGAEAGWLIVLLGVVSCVGRAAADQTTVFGVRQVFILFLVSSFGVILVCEYAVCACFQLPPAESEHRTEGGLLVDMACSASTLSRDTLARPTPCHATTSRALLFLG